MRSRPFLAASTLVSLLACGGPATPPPETGNAIIKTGPNTLAPPPARETWSDSAAPVPVTSDDPTWGDRNAPVTIVLYSDFECPFCSRVEATFAQIRETYGPSKVRVVWKNTPLPFHPHAKPAAEAAMGVFQLAGNDAFWQFHDLAFRNQRDLTEANFEVWAAQAGAPDLGAFKAGLTSHRWAEKVDADVANGKAIGVNGTPASFINGKLLSGAQPFEKFKDLIDSELAAVAAGAPSKDVYVARAKANFKAPAARDDDDGDKADTTTVWAVPLGNAPTRGPKTAQVTIIEFADFQCPYCRKVDETLKGLEAKYGGKVRFAWKDEPLPFHSRALPTAALAREARAQKGDKGFWDVHDKLFASQPKLEDGDLESIAKAAGLDVAKWRAHEKAETHADGIESDAELAESLEASGTPHFFINGRRLVGAQPAANFEAIIDEEIKKADARIAAGTKADAVYEAIVKTGKSGPGVTPPELRTAPAIPANAPSRGAANAKVVIQDFSDFQCPFCARVEPTIERVLKRYNGKVRVVWRDLPLPMHPDAPLAAEAAREVFAQKGAAGFWAFHDTLFASQTALGRDDLLRYAAAQKVDLPKLTAALDSHKHQPAVAAEKAAADKASISGTPAFFVNGYFISGAQPYSKFRQAVELALKAK